MSKKDLRPQNMKKNLNQNKEYSKQKRKTKRERESGELNNIQGRKELNDYRKSDKKMKKKNTKQTNNLN